MSIFKERVERLREKMAQYGMDAYVIPTSDSHQSEYVSDYFKFRGYISGFTGSAGTVVIFKDEAGLWTDGRYYIQAGRQLEGSGIDLFRAADDGVPSYEEYIAKKIPEGVIGFDGKVVGLEAGNSIAKKAPNAAIKFDVDLSKEIWEDRPALPANPVCRLGLELVGESSLDKIARMREAMKELGADVHLLSSLADIAWLFNIRGGDVLNTPVVLSYAALTQDAVHLYLNPAVLSDEVRAELEAEGVQIGDYEEIYEYVKTIEPGRKVHMDPAFSNYAMRNMLAEGVEVIEARNPELLAKSIKNPVEIENMKKGHIMDGVAFTKFMYWLKKNVGKVPMTEITASDYLADRRRELPGFRDLSFGTIAGYKANAAMMHYSAKPETAAVLEPEGMLLVDSGGQYDYGTTDITRTMILGPITDEMKMHYTAVLRGMMNLEVTNFLYGSRGTTVDIIARAPMWDMNLDYKCGTGHGVGYLLSVHEGPQRVIWRQADDAPLNQVLEEGMVVTDEPGIYLEGEYGIRIENELLVVKGVENEYGQFMHFEPLTMAPIDLDGVDPKYMTWREIQALNDYHKKVYEALAPYLTEEEAEWLKEYTREI